MDVEQSRWIWLNAPRGSEPGARTVIARRVFDRPSGESCTLEISANSVYRAWLNGQLVGRGPDRADPRRLFFDTWDVAGLLVPGRNVLLIEVRHIRPVPASRAWCLYGGEPGLIAELRGPSFVLATDERWPLMPAPGFLDDLPVISRFLGPQGHVDLEAARQIAAMHDPAYDDSGWPRAKRCEGLCTPRPRETPHLRRDERLPRDAGMIAPDPTIVEDTVGLTGFMPALPARVLPHPQGAWITLDFGRSMGGFPSLRFAPCAGGTVDVYCGEGTRWTMTDRVELPRGGEATLEPMDWRGARHVALHFHDLVEPTTLLSARFIDMAYPFEHRATFTSDDATLNSLYDICRLSAEVCLKDHPMDCVGREQALWLEDMVVHNRALLACFGDAMAMTKAVRQTLAVIHDDGVLPVPGPVGLGYRRSETILPWSTQPMLVPVILRDLYEFTGDAAPLREAMPALIAMDRHLSRYENESGLMRIKPPGLPALVPFGGWNPTLPDGRPAQITFQRIVSLRAGAEVAAATGDGERARAWRQRAEANAASAHAQLWDADRHLYLDGFDESGHRVTSVSPTANAWGALAGVLPASLAGAWSDALRRDPAVIGQWSPYDAAVLLDALLRYGLDLHARQLIDDYFGSIVRAGEPTLPEFWKQGEASSWRYHRRDDSRCHAYGAAPAYQCLWTVLGARAAEPGWRRAIVRPRSLGLRHAAGQVATPQGLMSVAWRRSDRHWELDLDSPIATVDVLLPTLGRSRQRLWVNGQQVWSSDGWPACEAAMRRDTNTAPPSAQVEHRLTSPGRHSLRLESV